MGKPTPAAELADDDLVSEIGDLIDEIGAKSETKEFANDIEEALDEDGELDEDRRQRAEELLTELRARQTKGDVMGDDEDLDDVEDEDEEEFDGTLGEPDED